MSVSKWDYALPPLDAVIERLAAQTGDRRITGPKVFWRDPFVDLNEVIITWLDQADEEAVRVSIDTRDTPDIWRELILAAFHEYDTGRKLARRPRNPLRRLHPRVRRLTA